MRLALFADIHGNLVALESVLRDVEHCARTGSCAWVTWLTDRSREAAAFDNKLARCDGNTDK
jgi:hypothetical protein